MCSFGGPKDRLWKCDAQALPYKANGAPRPPATVAAKKPLARRRDPRSSVCRHTSDRRKGSRGAPRTPRLQPVPRRARERAHRARGRLRCGPSPPERGGTHRGGLGTPLEGTYFQAEPGNAICVQSLDDSLNSAIHITYHISLRSSSLREPRYPSTGVVVWIVVSARTHETPQRAEPRARTRCGVGWSAPNRRRRRQARRTLPIDARVPLPIKMRSGGTAACPRHPPTPP